MDYKKKPGRKPIFTPEERRSRNCLAQREFRVKKRVESEVLHDRVRYLESLVLELRDAGNRLTILLAAKRKENTELIARLDALEEGNSPDASNVLSSSPQPASSVIIMPSPPISEDDEDPVSPSNSIILHGQSSSKSASVPITSVTPAALVSGISPTSPPMSPRMARFDVVGTSRAPRLNPGSMAAEHPTFGKCLLHFPCCLDYMRS